MRNKWFHFIVLLLVGVMPGYTLAQVKTQRNVERRLVAPDSVLNPITPNPNILDTIPPISQDTIPKTDSIPVGDIKTLVKYFAEDSIITDFRQNKIYLHKDAWFEYGTIRLDAELIVIDWEKSELFATGVEDSLGNIKGNPMFKEGATSYEIRKEMRYNFKTQKAIIKDVVTEQQDGLLRGQTIKKDADGSIYLDHGFYTTCNLAEPHWHINANKIKSIRGKQVVTGPFNLYFNNIPVPVGLPFGVVPDTPEEKASGIVFPSYGQEKVRGFFLRNFGYYFAFNDYVHTRITGDIFSKGGYGVKAQTMYKKRYKFTGAFNMDYQRFKTPTWELNPQDYNTFWVNWNHTPETRGNSRFSASVNAGTSNYNNVVVNPNNFMRNINSDFTSNVSYSKTFAGTPFSMSANLRHSQNIQSGEVNLMLPQIAVNMNRQNPFQNVQFEPLKTLNIAYNFELQNSITNGVPTPLGVPSTSATVTQGETANQNIIPFNLDNLPLLLQNANNGARSTIPITSNFRVFKHFTATAGVNYTEIWYLERINFFYNPVAERVDRIIEPGFNRIGFYNTNFALNTNIYGFYNVKGGGKLQTIRHHMQPSFSLNFTPDFSNPALGYYQLVQVDEDGRKELFSRHQGFIFQGAPPGESRSLGVNIRNVVEAKVRDTSKEDDENATKKIPLLQTLNLTTNYNFAADSFQLAPINMSARTSFFQDKLQVAMAANLDPYAELTTTNPETGQQRTRRFNSFAWRNGQGLGHFRTISMNLNGNINPSKSGKSPGEVRDDITSNFLQQGGQLNEFVEQEINRMVNDPSQYIDWNIPWDLSFGYNIAYSKQPGGNANITSAVNINGNLSISEKWKINFSGGYDFRTAQFTQTMLGIARDLHCWQMNVSWVPFGRFTSYNIDIRVKSSILQDLKVSRRRSFFDF